MIEKYNLNDWLWTFIIIEDKNMYITKEQSDLIDLWYSYINWEFIKEINKTALIDELEQLDNELVTLNWKIKGWEELVEMWVADEDDLKQIEEMKFKASEMINKRIEIKKQIKEL
jgi:hypothetical protein